MSEPVIQKYLEVETLSPLHIGSGERLRRKEFVQHGNRLWIADPRRLTERVGANQHLSERFRAFCEDERKSLADFLRENQIRPEEVSSYGVAAPARLSQEILCFIKTTHPRPYLPGSSIKGALRSAILRGVLSGNGELLHSVSQFTSEMLGRLKGEVRHYPGDRNRITKEYKTKISVRVQEAFFGPDQHHDLMRAIQIADSQPVDQGRLEIAEVKVLSASRRSLTVKQTRAGHDMVINPEVIRKGTGFKGSISFNVSLLGDKGPSHQLGFHSKTEAILGFQRLCNRVAEQLIEQEIGFFEQYNQRVLVNWYKQLHRGMAQLKKNQCLLHISWGSGFNPKTVTSLFEEGLFDEVRLAFDLGKFDRDQRGNRVMVKPFPKSRKVVFENGNPKEPLGWVRLTISER